MVSILIVEDNEELLALVAGFFKSKGSFDVYTAADGTAAIKLVDERDFDIAILDIMLPGPNGFEICKALRNKSRCPIVFLTALGNEENILEAELNREVVIECGDIRLYPLRMDVEAGGQKIKLAPKEYFLLKVLMENKGIVMDRNRLLDLVWGVGFDGTDRTVDSHIKKLRKSLGSCGGAIKTVIGGGYKIC